MNINLTSIIISGLALALALGLALFFFTITYAHKCVDFTPDNYTFTGNVLGVCDYETIGNLSYKKCTLNLVDTQNHGTIVGSSTCNKKSFELG
jgi:hypothetical protein